MNEVSWEYRQGGPISDEAIVLIPSISEDTSSMYLIASELMNSGYRVIVISIPPYESIGGFLNGFDLFTAKLRVGRIHLVGVGFGGFLAIHIASFFQLSAVVVSLIIISSFMSTALFKKPSGFFSKLTGKALLIDELCINQVPKYLKPSCEFIAEQLERIPTQVIASRLKLRSSAPNAPIPKMADNSILIVQSLDWAFRMNDNAVPHRVIKDKQLVALLANGGNQPQLAAPEKLMVYVKHHLEKWAKVSETENELDNEEEEDAN